MCLVSELISFTFVLYTPFKERKSLKESKQSSFYMTMTRGIF